MFYNSLELVYKKGIEAFNLLNFSLFLLDPGSIRKSFSLKAVMVRSLKESNESDRVLVLLVNPRDVLK